MRISTRLLWLFLAVSLAPLALLGYFTLQQNETMVRNEALDMVSDLADKKAMQVKNYMTERMREASRLAGSRIAQQGLADLSRLHAGKHFELTRYTQLSRQLDRELAGFVEDGGLFYDVFLITAQGTILYSYKHEADLSTNLVDGPYRDSPLATVFRETRMTLESTLSTFEQYAPSN